jgi:hypothetical protein
MTDLLLRRAAEPRAGAEGQDDYDVIGDVSDGHGLVIGRIFRASTAPAATPWMWRLSYEEREENGLEPTREMRSRANLSGRSTRSASAPFVSVLASGMAMCASETYCSRRRRNPCGEGRRSHEHVHPRRSRALASARIGIAAYRRVTRRSNSKSGDASH